MTATFCRKRSNVKILSTADTPRVYFSERVQGDKQAPHRIVAVRAITASISSEEALNSGGLQMSKRIQYGSEYESIDSFQMMEVFEKRIYGLENGVGSLRTELFHQRDIQAHAHDKQRWELTDSS